MSKRGGLGRGFDFLAGDSFNCVEQTAEHSEVRISQIEATQYFPKYSIERDEYQRLLERVKLEGLAEPLLLRPLGRGKFRLMAGEMKLQAAREAGLKKVPVELLPATELEGDQGAKIIVVANQKGGVGKTTTTINLAAGLAILDFRVLVVDADPPNASRGLGFEMELSGIGLVDQVHSREELIAAKASTALGNLDLISFHTKSRDGGQRNFKLPMVEKVLKMNLDKLRSHYDFILIDSSPSLGLITVSTLIAADSVIVPVQGEYFALEGLEKLLNTVRIIKTRLNPGLCIEGFLVTMFDNRLNLSNETYQSLKQAFGHLVFDTVIRRNVRLGEAPRDGKPLLMLDASSTGAINHLYLARELARRNGLLNPRNEIIRKNK